MSEYKKNLLRFVFDPLEGMQVKRGKKTEALKEIAEFIHSEILSFVGDGRSPVEGEGWKKQLNKNYAIAKSKVSGSSVANMELHGDMLDALRVRVFNKNKLAVEMIGKQAEKADGHNKLTGRRNKNPRRRFIPGEKQRFKKDIMEGIEGIVEEFEEFEDDGA
jgi:hypothetical protein